MDINLTPKLKEKMKPRVRIRGRYNSSEMYFITHGKVTPEQWINPSEKTVKEMLRMWSGTGMHNQLEGLLGKENCETKMESTYKDITLVGIVDYFPPDDPDSLWEFKTSEHTMASAKPWHEYQVKLYCSMFRKENGMVYQPVQDEDGIYLKHLGTVKCNDGWFMEELEKLYQFHLKVEELWENKLKKKHENAKGKVGTQKVS